MKGILSVILLIISNAFMTFAWYGHLHWKNLGFFAKLGMFGVIMLSWGIALFEYIFQVPANKIGYEGNGGPFSMFELKTIQEVVSLTVFSVITIFVFKTEKLQWNHMVGFFLIVMAVFFVFKKW